MTKFLCLTSAGALLASAVVGAAAGAGESGAAHHRASAPTSAAVAPNAGGRGDPYAHAGDGDNGGLSRNPDDCNKGCIGGNPD